MYCQCHKSGYNRSAQYKHLAIRPAEHPLPQIEAGGRKVYPVAPQQQLQHQQRNDNHSLKSASNFPAILQNSMDKLQMNFIQNKAISEPIEYHQASEKLEQSR